MFLAQKKKQDILKKELGSRYGQLIVADYVLYDNRISGIRYHMDRKRV